MRSISSTWENLPLSTLTDIRFSNVDKKTEQNEIDVRLCNYTDVYYNNFIRPDMQFMEATATKREIEKCALCKDDVVITKDSEKHDDIGVPALVRENIKGLVCGYHLAIIRPLKQIYGPYLFYALSSPAVQRQFHAYANGVTRFGLRKADVGIVGLPVPPYTEQRTIAHVLGTLEEKIGLNQRMNETLEKMARALFKSWFVDFDPVRAKMEGRDSYLPSELWNLFPEALDDEGKPAGWETSEIGKEVAVVGGSTPSTKKSEYWDQGDHHWVTPRDLSNLASPVLLSTERKITAAGVAKINSGLLPTGTVLLSSRAPIGYLAIAEVQTAVNQGFIAMVCKKRLPSVFILFWCEANLARIESVSSGSTFAEISKKEFRPLTVIVPSGPALAAFEGFVRPLYHRIVTNVQDSALLIQTRDVLLPKLVSGELCVKDIEKFVERVV